MRAKQWMRDSRYRQSAPIKTEHCHSLSYNEGKTRRKILFLYFFFILQYQRSLLVVVFSHTCNALSLLGAGEGRGSCPAPPYRASQVNWPNGCPLNVPCCNEFGYCRTEV